MEIKILVIDDDDEIRDFVEQVLVSKYSVTLCATAQDGLQKMKSEKFDLIITDLQIGGASGFDVLKEIQTLSPVVPSIMMSSFTTLNYQSQAEKFGASDYLYKPFEYKTLIEAIEKILDKKKG
ncbi:MAG: hypothetical protein A3J83_07835 [Elusimicrobia bacterium RIFOXYA2_FULL_40_6]|nr:MAG: hypothetical protein A3J83_07835 [Elusimicrobia bacterium RIFOXYA2_FULL_40_6]